MRNRIILAALLGTAAGLSGSAQAATTVVTVSANQDIILAGQPIGTSPPVALTGFTTGSAITFSGIGGFSNTPSAPSAGLDGNQPFNQSSAFNIAGIVGGRLNSLVGVFLTDNAASSPTPPSRDDGTSFSSLSPLLQQVFFIGDGLTGTGTGTLQQFFAPAGATRLYLGSTDEIGTYSNNAGSANVTINFTSNAIAGPAPEPATWALMIVGFGLVGGALRSRRRAKASLVAA